MPKRLAITIAGAVSLGSYESGVLWEVLDAIKQHNNSGKTAPQDKIIIDVITGASAGGMTAAILAQKLLYSADEFKGPYDNPLYYAWVERISLDGLQHTGPKEKALQSVFSSDLITAISTELITKRYKDGKPPAAIPHAAVNGSLSIGLALTNLNGLPFTHNVTPGGSFTYIDYSDQLTRRIDASADDNEVFWEPIRAAAVACGAFPIAFRPQELVRSKAADPEDYTSPTLAWNGGPTPFTYSDGGILQNQPLGMAKNLVDPIDQHVEPDRFYMFVSPHEKDPAPVTFEASSATYFQMAKRLIGVGTGQAGFQDWITANEVNERICTLDERARELKDVINRGQITVSALQEVATQLLVLFFPNNQHHPPGGQSETLDQAKDRISKQYESEMKDLAGIAGAAIAFRDAILAFESAAGLGARDLMIIYGITAKESELASTGIQSFLGFFDQRYRDHDYDVGRDHAQKILLDPVLGLAGQIGPLNFTPGILGTIDESLNGPQLHQLSPADLRQFRTGMKHRVNQMLLEINPGLILADPIADLLVDAIIGHVTGS
jgi:hypothetical protein